MSLPFEYDETKPGTRELGLPTPLPASRLTMDVDTLNRMAEEKAAAIARNTRELEKAYVKHQNVLVRFDRLIRSVRRIADTPELEKLLLDLHAQRATAERLLFTGGAELRKDEMTTHFKEG